jgi:hypothetical protein
MMQQMAGQSGAEFRKELQSKTTRLFLFLLFLVYPGVSARTLRPIAHERLATADCAAGRSCTCVANSEVNPSKVPKFQKR